MTTLEAHVAQNAPAPDADPAKVSASLSPEAAKAPGGVSTISDYQAEKAALLAQQPPAAPSPSVPEDLETQIQRDEFGDEIHDPDKDAGLPAASPVPTQEEPPAVVDPEGDKLLPHRIPTKQFSREEQEALALKHLLETENPGQTFSLKECLDRVEAKYGKQPAAPAAQPDPNALDPNLPQSLHDLDKLKRENAKAIREKRTEIAKAETELRYDDKLALIEELNSLETKNETLDDYAPRLASHEEARNQKFTQDYTSSANRAVELYPDAQVKGTAFYNRMAEIDALLRDTNDPRYHSQDKPLLIAQMVAKEQDVAPKGKGVAKATPTAPQPPVIAPAGNLPAHLAPPVASGSARTTTPLVSSADAAIAAVRTPEQLENLKLQLLGRHAA